jgi:hypothetical protein
MRLRRPSRPGARSPPNRKLVGVRAEAADEPQAANEPAMGPRPNIEIVVPAQGTTIRQRELDLTYSAQTPSGDAVARVEALIDGNTTQGSERILTANDDARVGIIRINLPRRDAIVSIVAHNKHGASEPASVQIIWAGPGSDPKPKLYILAIGINTYPQEKMNLLFPVKDAEDFVKTVTEGAAGLYETVIPCPSPPEGKWTHNAVLDGLDWIKKEPTTRDVAIVFISGHGIVTPDQVYRFLPCDYDPAREERTTVRSLEFQDFLSKIGGKVLVFLDTCHAGDVLRRGGKGPHEVRIDRFAEELAAAGEGAVVFASSTGDQRSWEDPAWGNGAFTKALVEGLRGDADKAKAGVVRVAALEEYVCERVKDLTSGQQKPKVAKPDMVENFPIVAVST